MVHGFGGSASLADMGAEDSKVKRSAEATVLEKRIAKERVGKRGDTEQVLRATADSWLL